MAQEPNTNPDLWLPADFFYGDFSVQDRYNLRHLNNNPPLIPRVEEPSNFNEDYMAFLARRMATSFALDDDVESGMRRNRLAAKNLGDSMITHRQIQAAQFHRLRQQQLMKQQATSEYGHHSKRPSEHGHHQSRMKARECYDGSPVGFSPTVQFDDSGMRAAFPRKEKREIGGTGVFLPRTAGAKETKKKAGCSTIVVPARVVQALNLNLEEFGDLPRVSDGYVFDHGQLEALTGRSNGVQRINSYGHQSYRHRDASAIAGCQIQQLPNQWGFDFY